MDDFSLTDAAGVFLNGTHDGTCRGVIKSEAADFYCSLEPFFRFDGAADIFEPRGDHGPKPLLEDRIIEREVVLLDDVVDDAVVVLRRAFGSDACQSQRLGADFLCILRVILVRGGGTGRLRLRRRRRGWDRRRCRNNGDGCGRG